MSNSSLTPIISGVSTASTLRVFTGANPRPESWARIGPAGTGLVIAAGAEELN
jgi:hypothetical protein